MWIGGNISEQSASDFLMLENVEYKTGRYYLGKPVYTKIFKTSGLEFKDMYIPVGELVIDRVVNIQAMFKGKKEEMEYQYPVPYYSGTGSYVFFNKYDSKSKQLVFASNSEWVNYYLWITLEYTKLIDPVVTA